jgi:hypothetical protein
LFFIWQRQFEKGRLATGHNSYARIEEGVLLPTVDQGFACIRVCQMLSSGYRDIHLFRFNTNIGTIYILADESLEILIDRDGTWRFLDEARL